MQSGGIVGKVGMEVLSEPSRPLDSARFGYLRPPAGTMETYAGRLPFAVEPFLAPNPDSRPEPPPAGGIDAFSGEIEPYDLETGNSYYRVVGEGSLPNGSFWSEIAVTSEEQVRRALAIRNDWNGDHGQIVLILRRTIRGWRGMVGPQLATGSTTLWLEGGGTQIWVPRDTLGPEDGDWFIGEVGDEAT